MNYVKNFYNRLKIITNEEELSQVNIPLKINKKYLIKNAILFPVFRDEFKIFEQQRHNKYLKNLDVSCDSENNTNNELEKDEIMYTSLPFNYSLNKELNKEKSELTDDINFKKYENINEHMENIDNLEIKRVCESDEEEQINKEINFTNEKKIQLKNILKSNLLIGLLLSCYYLKIKFER